MLLTVFAYGATGAGKTYTMLGTAESPGVTFSAVMTLFSKIDDNKTERIYDVSVSYLEVFSRCVVLCIPNPKMPLINSAFEVCYIIALHWTRLLTFCLFFWYSAVLAGHWLPSLRRCSPQQTALWCDCCHWSNTQSVSVWYIAIRDTAHDHGLVSRMRRTGMTMSCLGKCSRGGFPLPSSRFVIRVPSPRWMCLKRLNGLLHLPGFGIRVFLLLGTVCPRHLLYPVLVLPSWSFSRGFPYLQPGDAGGCRSAPAVCQSLTSADTTISKLLMW